MAYSYTMCNNLWVTCIKFCKEEYINKILNCWYFFKWKRKVAKKRNITAYYEKIKYEVGF